MVDFSTELYQASLEGTALFQIPDPGCLLISGPDRAAFIQRQTSNDIRSLAPDRAVLSVLTSPTARILDVLTLLEESPGETGKSILLTLPGRSSATFRFLKSRIFFNDKVSLEDASSQWVQLDLFGPQAGAVLQALGLEEALLPNEVARLPAGPGTLRVFRTAPPSSLGYRLLLPVEESTPVCAALQDAGALALDSELYELLRIESGLPGPQHELTEAYTPLETRLEHAVSDKKGCYTGQEVLARQVTYDKVTQKMVGLKLTGPEQPGQRVWEGGKLAGEITSAARSPRFGWIALAVLKRAFLEPGLQVTVGTSAESAQPASVTTLPFSENG